MSDTYPSEEAALHALDNRMTKYLKRPKLHDEALLRLCSCCNERAVVYFEALGDWICVNCGSGDEMGLLRVGV